MSDPFLADLSLTRRGLGVGSSDRDAVDLRVARGDLVLAAGRENLAQAILNRLYTRRGALAALGHPAYGSRLHRLAGEPDTGRTRALAEFYIREALAGEPRVAEVAEVVFEGPDRLSPLRNALVAHVRVLPAAGGAPLTLSLTATLDA